MGKTVERYQDRQRHISSPTFDELLVSSNHLNRHSDFNPDYKNFLRLVDDEEVEKYLQQLGTKLLAFKVYYERHKKEIGKELGVSERLLGGEILNISIGQVQEQVTQPDTPMTVFVQLRSWGIIMVTKPFCLSEEIRIDHEELSREFIDAVDVHDRQNKKSLQKRARMAQ